jgi:lambda family phage portal protein
MNFFGIGRKKQSTKRIFRRGFSLFSPISGQSNGVSTLKPSDYSFVELRKMARDLSLNNDYVKRFLFFAESSIVGPRGIRLQVRETGTDPRYTHEVYHEIESKFRRWGTVGRCDVTKRYNWVDIQKIVIKSILRDGESIIRLLIDQENGLRLQLIDSDQLSETANFAHKKNQVVSGVEFDAFGAPVAYWIKSRFKRPGEGSLPERESLQRIPAEEILHLFFNEHVGQVRGHTALSSAISSLNLLDQYKEAELKSSVASSRKMGFYTRDTEQALGEIDFFPENERGEMVDHVESGQNIILPPGVKFVPFDPQHPSKSFSEFCQTILMGVSSSLNINYSSFSGDLSSVNFSSLRQGEISQRDSFRNLQQWLITHFMRPVFERWLNISVLRGDLPIRSEDIDLFVEPRFSTRAYEWVDPLKNAQANAISVQNGFKTLDDVWQENGKDYDEQIEQIRKERDVKNEIFDNNIENSDVEDEE